MKRIVLLQIAVLLLTVKVFSITPITLQTEPATIPQLTQMPVASYSIFKDSILVRLGQGSSGDYCGRIPIGTKMAEFIMAKLTRFSARTYEELVTLYPKTTSVNFVNRTFNGKTLKIADCEMIGIKFERQVRLIAGKFLSDQDHNLESYAFFINSSGAQVLNSSLWLLGTNDRLESLETYSFSINQSTELDYFVGRLLLIRLISPYGNHNLRIIPVPGSSQPEGFEFQWQNYIDY